MQRMLCSLRVPERVRQTLRNDTENCDFIRGCPPLISEFTCEQEKMGWKMPVNFGAVE
jgi:hypothetical protein